MQLPHRAITPDTVVFYEDGVPLLLPSLADDPMPELADDLIALARILHYAITQEVVPVRPLRGRALEGYSDSLITAIDRSLAADPARRPRSIGELRDLLGIVVFRRSAPARGRTHAVPASVGVPALRTLPVARPPPSLPSGRIRHRRWALAGGGAAILLIVGSAMLAGQRDASTFAHSTRLAPESRAVVRAHPSAPLPPAPALPEPGPTVSQTDAVPDAIPLDASDAPAPDAMQAPAVPANGSRRAKPAARARVAAVPAAAPGLPQEALPGAPVSAASAPPPPPAAGATFDLQIQPWGVVYVDGVRRGISPPVKQLVLAPGRHAVRVTNPGARERVLDVDTARGGGQIAVNFDSEPQ